MKDITQVAGVSRRLYPNNKDTPIRPADRFLTFGAPQIEDAEIEEVVASMRSGWLGTGPKVARFNDGCYDEQSALKPSGVLRPPYLGKY